MTASYTQEQRIRAFEKLPEELQEAIFSTETANAIRAACENQGITDGRMGEIAGHAGDVLMGLVLPEEFQGIIQKERKLTKKVAEAIAREINRFVFFPVRPALRQIHQVGVDSSSATPKTEEPEPQEETPPEPEQPTPKQPKGPDAYRESIE